MLKNHSTTENANDIQHEYNESYHRMYFYISSLFPKKNISSKNKQFKVQTTKISFKTKILFNSPTALYLTSKKYLIKCRYSIVNASTYR